jgi:hypothetical protein
MSLSYAPIGCSFPNSDPRPSLSEESNLRYDWNLKPRTNKPEPREDAAVRTPPGLCRPVKRASAARRRVFLLSPANASGLRAKAIFENSEGQGLGARLRCEGAPLGDIFSIISGLYFRGKLAYARAFANPPPGGNGVSVITASGGLVSPDKIFTIEDLRSISAAAIDPADPRYRVPLLRDAQRLAVSVGARCDVVLLGSVATPKYIEPLLTVFGERLLFPAQFVGRGDMSRGGLMLRCERAGVELSYLPVSRAILHGPRPPKLAKLAPQAGARGL